MLGTGTEILHNVARKVSLEGDICLKTCKKGESMNLSAGRVLRVEGTASAKALWWEHDWHVGGTAGHLCGWSVVNK